MEDNIIIATEMLVVGMSTVFIVLGAFAFVIWFLKKVDALLLRNQAAPSVDSGKAVLETIAETGSNTDITVVIAAAVSAVIGKKVKVKKIHFLDTQHDEANWSHSGRLNIMGSHNINIKGH